MRCGAENNINFDPGAKESLGKFSLDNLYDFYIKPAVYFYV